MKPASLRKSISSSPGTSDKINNTCEDVPTNEDTTEPLNGLKETSTKTGEKEEEKIVDA